MHFGLSATATPYSKEALKACGVDPEAINPATNEPNWVYPGNLPPETLQKCQEQWGVPVILPYGTQGPSFVVMGGDIGRPADPVLANGLIALQTQATAAAGGAPVMLNWNAATQTAAIAAGTAATAPPPATQASDDNSALIVGGLGLAAILLLVVH